MLAEKEEIKQSSAYDFPGSELRFKEATEQSSLISVRKEKKWTIVAFDHPTRAKSVVYVQGLSEKGLLKYVARAMELGCNLMSIRGFDE